MIKDGEPVQLGAAAASASGVLVSCLHESLLSDYTKPLNEHTPGDIRASVPARSGVIRAETTSSRKRRLVVPWCAL